MESLIDTSKGFLKVYWDLYNKLSTTDEVVLLSYIIDVEPIMKARDRNGEYFRLSDSFIRERLYDWTGYKIRTNMKKLVDKGFIEMDLRFVNEHNLACSTRWIRFTDQLKDSIKGLLNEPINEPIKAPIKKLNGNNNTITQDLNNTIYNGESSSPTENKSSSDNSSSKRKSRKDQLVEYVNATSFEQETKDTLFKWIFQIGLKGNVTVDQLRDMLKNIWHECSGNELLVREAISNSYLNNWFGFYPPKKSSNSSEKTPSNHLTLDNNKNPALTDARVVQRVQIGDTTF